MKHLNVCNLWAVALALLAGFAFTSCLDDDDDNNVTNSRTGVGKLYYTYGSYVFKTSDGYTITPSYNSVASALANGLDLSSYAGQVLFFAYDVSAAAVDEVAKTATDVTFNGCMSLSNTVEVVEGTAEDSLPNDSIGNTPILSLENSTDKPCFMFDDVTLFVPANYTMSRIENYVTLVYYTDEPEDNGEVMRLHLRYNSKGGSLNGTVTSYDYYNYNLYYYLKFYDLSRAFSAYRSKNGYPSNPETIQIVTQENSYSLDLGDNQTVEKVYTVSRN